MDGRAHILNGKLTKGRCKFAPADETCDLRDAAERSRNGPTSETNTEIAGSRRGDPGARCKGFAVGHCDDRGCRTDSGEIDGVSQEARMNGEASLVSPLFSGKDEAGEKRRDHGHVYILPLSNEDGRVDRILIPSPLRFFTQEELDAVMGVEELWQRDDRGKVYCAVTWQGVMSKCPVRNASVVAESATPFVPPRHWRKGRDFDRFLADEVRRECRNHGIPEPVAVETRRMRGHFYEVEYRRNRKKDPVRPGYSLQLTFTSPVATPFAIGYGAHFGLGQFWPVAR